MQNRNKIRVLVVDDSALARKIISSGLSRDPRLEVIATASNPLIAFDLLAKHRPDVITLDIEMPEMDGVTFLRKFMPVYPTPTVVVSSLAERGKRLALEALEAGAVDVITKPKVGIVDNLPLLMEDVCDRVVQAARVDMGRYARLLPKVETKPNVPSAPSQSVQPPSASEAMHETTDRVIAIGASAGGVSTLAHILPMFPPAAPGVVIVQHMPAGFTTQFANRLDGLCQMRVKEAEDGDRVRPGLALLAPGGDRHLEVRRSGGEYRVKLTQSQKVSWHCPSVDVLFHSVAHSVGRNATAAILTGMGNDGADGMLAIRKAGGRTFAQDEQTSVVFGMPKAAWENGAAEMLVALDDIPAHVLRAAKT